MSDWIQQAKVRGFAAPLRILLDVLEPLGPLGAQVLYVAQPVSRVLGASEAVRHLAEALEEPGGIDRLRERLDD
ncbi:MAG TPA: hypothetical protein VKY59_20160 [Spirillospora sp.]|nr:hypothetical protein [Spirillospora sp.]